MWIAKESKIRRQEFIDTAIEIFKVKGYEKSSINDILKQMQVTKGSFYHNFKSKEDLLNAVVDYLLSDIENILIELEAKQDNALNKLYQLYSLMTQYRSSNKELYSQLYLNKQTENAFLIKKLQQQTLRLAMPYIQRIIKQGVNEQIFNTSNVKETAEIYIRLAILCKEKLVQIVEKKHEQSIMQKEITEILEFYQQTLKRILGVQL